jgi:hypothetical protein
MNKSILRDVKKALEGAKYDITEKGIVLLNKLHLGGVFDAWVERDERMSKALESGDPEFIKYIAKLIRKEPGYRDILMADSTPNLVPDAGLNYILDLLFYTDTKTNTWYIGPFKSDSTPAAAWASNWAGASSGPLATELTNAEYDETNRQALAFASAASTKSISSTTAATFTMASGVSGVTLYGATVNSIATVAYDSTDEELIAATRFASAKSGLVATDVVNINYSFSAADA